MTEPKLANYLALTKGDQNYVWVFTDEQASNTRHLIAEMAADPKLNLTWFDAAQLAKKINQLTGQSTMEPKMFSDHEYDPDPDFQEHRGQHLEAPMSPWMSAPRYAAKTVASAAVCGLGAYAMSVSGDHTALLYVLGGLFLIWGLDN